MNLRIDLKILTLEPQASGLTLIEARALDGTDVALTVRVAEPLAVGGWLTMALLAEPTATQPAAAGPSMRERVQARANGLAAPTQAPRAATTATATAAAAPAAVSEASSLLLSSILGNRPNASKIADFPDNSPLIERNVDDEMDALLGAPPRKG